MPNKSITEELVGEELKELKDNENELKIMADYVGGTFEALPGWEEEFKKYYGMPEFTGETFVKHGTMIRSVIGFIRQTIKEEREQAVKEERKKISKTIRDYQFEYQISLRDLLDKIDDKNISQK